MSRLILFFSILLVGGAFLFIVWPKEQDLNVSPEILAQLQMLRAQHKYVDPNGIIRSDEQARLEPLINDMLDRLIEGLPTNPRKSWALSEIKKTVARFYLEDTELREPSVEYIAQVIKVLGIQHTDWAFARYMIFL